VVDIALATLTITAVFLLQGLAGIVFFFTPVVTTKFVAGLGTQFATAAEELAKFVTEDWLFSLDVIIYAFLDFAFFHFVISSYVKIRAIFNIKPRIINNDIQSFVIFVCGNRHSDDSCFGHTVEKQNVIGTRTDLSNVFALIGEGAGDRLFPD